jgi:outer membrane protein assembly factor BamB
MKYLLGVLLAGIALSAAPAAPLDWPQWRGPDRTGLSKETGLMRQWPAAGPALVWSAGSLGRGYGSIAVSGDRIYLQGMQGANSGVSARNPAAGKPVWWSARGR